MEALAQMSLWHCSEARKTATMLSNSICQSDFIVSLIVLETLSAHLLPTTRALQNLIEALGNLNDLLLSIKNLRTSEIFSKLFEEAGQVAKLLDVTLTKPRTAKLSVHRPSSIGDDMSAEAYYRINVFYPTLDMVIADIDFRFSPKKQQVMFICRVIPALIDFTTADEEMRWQELERGLEPYLTYFRDPVILIKSEFKLWCRKWEQISPIERPKSACSALDHCGLHFPNISLMLQLLATLPITTAEAERLFSKLESTLTAIRASMQETRLEALLLLQVHKESTPSIEAVIDRFAMTSARRLNFCL
jgi:hypothetical protein